MLILASAFAINAQSLTGKEWCTMIHDGDEEEYALEMKFENNGTCEIEIVKIEEMKEGNMKMSIEMELDAPGTYKLNGKDLSINLNKGQAKIDFDVDIDGMDAQTKAKLIQMIQLEFEKSKDEAKEEMFNVIPNMENMKVVSLDNNRLVLVNGTGTEITFYATQD